MPLFSRCPCKCRSRDENTKLKNVLSKEDNLRRARMSVTRAQMEKDLEKHGNTDRLRKMMLMQNALQFMPAQLSAATYGLEVVGNNKYVYQPSDFFEFKNTIGQGGSSIVFRALFKPENKYYAVKYISNFKSFGTYVIREIEVLRLVRGYQFLSQYHSHFRDGNNLYIVVELYEGGSLSSLISPRVTVPPNLGRLYMMEVCSGLMYLHKIKVAHRDVHPGNIVISSHGHCRLIDFANCKIMEKEKGVLITDCGQPAYRAPEIYLDKMCTVAIDWWSVGIMLYRFCTGQTPFNTEKMWQGHQAVTKLKAKYPEWAFHDHKTLHFCQRLLDKNPKTRLGSIDERSEIVGNPYFKSIDWNVEQNVGDLILHDMNSGAGDRYLGLYRRLAALPGVAVDMECEILPGSAAASRRGSRAEFA